MHARLCLRRAPCTLPMTPTSPRSKRRSFWRTRFTSEAPTKQPLHFAATPRRSFMGVGEIRPSPTSSDHRRARRHRGVCGHGERDGRDHGNRLVDLRIRSPCRCAARDVRRERAPASRTTSEARDHDDVRRWHAGLVRSGAATRHAHPLHRDTRQPDVGDRRHRRHRRAARARGNITTICDNTSRPRSRTHTRSASTS